MSEETRAYIQRLVQKHGAGQVAKLGQVSLSAVTSWMRPESNKAHRAPHPAVLVLLGENFGDGIKQNTQNGRQDNAK